MGLDYEMQLTMSGVLNVCQVVACLWSLWGMDRFGRRKLLLGGGVCMVSGISIQSIAAVLTMTTVLRSLHHRGTCWSLPRQLADAHGSSLDLSCLPTVLHAHIRCHLGSNPMGNAC